MLSVSPSACRASSDERIDSGIETAMMQVLRQLPEEQQDHRGRQRGGDQRFAHHAADGCLDEDRLVEQAA
jgi:hypothetical protein